MGSAGYAKKLSQKCHSEARSAEESHALSEKSETPHCTQWVQVFFARSPCPPQAAEARWATLAQNDKT
jgi:hypothetical protein